MRVYELAKELNVTSRRILDLLPGLGIAATSHSSSLTERDAARIRTALGGATEGRVVRFDKKTGKGEVQVSTVEVPMEFDLASTPLESTRYAPIEPGNKVHVQLDGDRISSIAVDS
jgi:Translation initiation factor IF-2, N-terminal region